MFGTKKQPVNISLMKFKFNHSHHSGKCLLLIGRSGAFPWVICSRKNQSVRLKAFLNFELYYIECHSESAHIVVVADMFYSKIKK